ncbi:MAG: hypothetical protein HC769_11795, partial [Cyanobacteria bacterium CRU_2_1]|nr:hypothetical protein [Cyanobacteria bacterium CRU_2_1]
MSFESSSSTLEKVTVFSLDNQGRIADWRHPCSISWQGLSLIALTIATNPSVRSTLSVTRFQSYLSSWVRHSHRSVAVYFRAALIGTLTGTLISSPILVFRGWAQSSTVTPAPIQSQQDRVLGVVQSEDNADQWQGIIDRLEAGDISYQVIEWQQVQRETEFRHITVLLLPNVETITSDQFLALQDWVNRGGRLIVTGQIGNHSSAGVQRALRSLVGAYWVDALPEPATLDPMILNSHRWLREGDASEQIVGGVLVPNGLSSQSVATWDHSDTDDATRADRVAIVLTQQAIYLGWNWGSSDSGSIEFDSSWLSAALTRFQNSPSISPPDSPVATSPPLTPLPPPSLPP